MSEKNCYGCKHLYLKTYTKPSENEFSSSTYCNETWCRFIEVEIESPSVNLCPNFQSKEVEQNPMQAMGDKLIPLGNCGIVELMVSLNDDTQKFIERMVDKINRGY